MNAYTDENREGPNDVPITRADMEPGHGQMRVEATDKELLAMGFSLEWIAEWRKKEQR